MITVGKHANLKVCSKAEVVVKRSTAGCCAHLGTNYVQDDAKGKCVVSAGLGRQLNSGASVQIHNTSSFHI